jgi:hypothetical protein
MVWNCAILRRVLLALITEWCERLAARIHQTEAALVSEMARAYVKALPEIETASLSQLIKEASRK